MAKKKKIGILGLYFKISKVIMIVWMMIGLGLSLTYVFRDSESIPKDIKKDLFNDFPRY